MDGLAVKARSIIPNIWSSGQYQEDAGLGDDVEWIELNARSLIEDCLHLAGIDWKGRRWRDVAPASGRSASPAPEKLTAHTPKASADSVDLSNLAISELCALYETTGAVREFWTGAMCLPLAVQERGAVHGLVTRTPFGDLADYEDSRLGFIRDRIASEAASRSPASKWDRDNLMALRIQQEIACEGCIRDAGLLADILQAWG